MTRLTVDKREIEVAKGATILDAAAKVGIVIPTMCFLEGLEPFTSCMLCVVKVHNQDGLVPACGTLAEDGMHVQTDTEEIRQARRTALELLLSDHLGDCMGPCQLACPAKMNIPLMLRQIISGELELAIATIKRDIALPAVLGRICPAPCEKVCRRAQFDQAVTICQLKRYVADVDLKSPQPYAPSRQSSRQKRVAIVGAGPAGLSAAYYLLQEGFDCTVFDDHDEPGGMLRYGISEKELPRDVLDAEIAAIEKLGFEFRGLSRVGVDLSLEQLRRDFDAVFVATGRSDADEQNVLGLKTGPRGILVDTRTYQTELADVFAGGDAIRSRRLTVRSVADGKEAAVSIGQYLSGHPAIGPIRPFNSRMGKLKEGEIQTFMAAAEKVARIEPQGMGRDYSAGDARSQARRCLHCDCRKAQNCKLRDYAQQYAASSSKFKTQRRTFVRKLQHPRAVFEPGKCIDCGLCIQIASKAGEELGLTFIGRGFDVTVAVPFDRSIAEGLQRAAEQCVDACPTGALGLKEDLEANE